MSNSLRALHGRIVYQDDQVPMTITALGSPVTAKMFGPQTSPRRDQPQRVYHGSAPPHSDAEGRPERADLYPI